MFTLTELDISYNYINSIPAQLVKCESLKDLLVEGNPDITFPNNFALFKRLTTLSLSRNRLSSLPDIVCTLPALEHMDLSFNQLITLTPKIGGMTTLGTLLLGSNKLKTLPSEIGKCTNLKYLDIKENNLNILPDEMACLGLLEELILSNNELMELPKTVTLKKLPKLYKLDAYSNKIGYLSETFFEGAQDSALEELHLGRNHISELPENFWTCDFLLIDLKNNHLSQLSPKIGHFTRLTILNLAHNRLTSLPNEIGQCTDLLTLNLFGNCLSDLPKSFRSLNRIHQIYLGYNQLVEFPFLNDTFYEELEELFLNGNPIKKLSSNIGENAPGLKYLFINNMELTEIPPEVGFLAYLEQLDCSHNQLTTIPIEIFRLRCLYSLDFSHNQLVNTPNDHPEVIKHKLPKDNTDDQLCYGEDIDLGPKIWDLMDWSSDLQSVEIVNFSYNQLEKIPVGCQKLIEKKITVFVDGNSFSTTLGLNPRFNVGWSEMVGRRPSQEDCLCIAGPIGDPKHNMLLFGLFDGHCGVYSARFAAEHFKEHLLQKLVLTSLESPLKSLVDALISVNEALREYADKTDRAARHSGTTAIVALIIGRQLYVANVGDARAVLYEGGDTSSSIENDHRPFSICQTTSVIRLSQDHKPDLEEDRIRKDGGYVIRSRINGILGVSRSIGDFSTPAVRCLPSAYYYPLPVNQDGFIILACDGLWDELSDQEACSIVHSHACKGNRDPHKMSAILRDYAYFFGSDDNISVILINYKK